MKKKFLTLALTLIFCCMGLLAFSGCEQKAEYVLCVYNNATECYQYVRAGEESERTVTVTTKEGTTTSTITINGKYNSLNEYKEAVFANIKVTCLKYKADGTLEKAWQATGIKELRQKGASLDGWNGAALGSSVVQIKYGHDIVEFDFNVVDYTEAGQQPSVKTTNTSALVVGNNETLDTTEQGLIAEGFKPAGK